MPCLLVWSGLPWWGSHEEPGATVNRVRLSGLDYRHSTTLWHSTLGIRLSAIDTRQSAPSFSVRLPASEYPVSSSSSIRQQQQFFFFLFWVFRESILSPTPTPSLSSSLSSSPLPSSFRPSLPPSPLTGNPQPIACT
ncbi:hypothetical protein BDB00DRAFT_929885 [Zychaea mexicana]|uniref:uncharacterized protein n=1 Tax=Zychaea mexicana TaxID=64656 RepID=UPI0022FE7E57|nr:uncharacterized protein BDB00DRAFT_929885 [Zychaea mexicana]KAI9492164.1 hypothetical protein BDB00DRAFT_929885 [Zychaea mexicana]